MSAEVKILMPGFISADSIAETGEGKTQPTVTLIKDGDIVAVADPGVMENQQVLVDALVQENISLKDVNFVFLTHSHLDHYRNAGMFPDAKIVEYFGVWDKNTVNEWKKQFSPNIKIIKTPGHDYTDITFLITTLDGVIAVCGDVFWREDYPHNPNEDTFALDPVKLAKSREMVIKMADWIIPGHGPMFKSFKNGEAKKQAAILKAKYAKAVVVCRKCHKQIDEGDRCLCRPWLCYNCCECCFDCELCSCSHRRR